ncbi:hypothetical protein SPHV1_630004 [Novosphingobium sp. KN65.2]|nr:hypothetical protein SPHV1_630004 [Novosphingobium sp. KN65.2]
MCVFIIVFFSLSARPCFPLTYALGAARDCPIVLNVAWYCTVYSSWQFGFIVAKWKRRLIVDSLGLIRRDLRALST